ncbi:hypothetical protein AU099_gp85 [Gordonia phage GTE8]|uniref:Uncharacterized protein n=1 Tax=Gordonia phage GTE8 TaxID=1647475 RepID=A0A0K0N6R2_9CAUD|nr:hypothetical protein AU099_gp85 [Gordonia phage GTE8]AKJ72428.1 hypothetical protein GTE8_85 [Gordonia phage GTE8]
MNENTPEPDETGTEMHELLEKYLGFPPKKNVQVSLPRQHSKNLLRKALEAGVPTEPTELPEGMEVLGFTEDLTPVLLPELRRKAQEVANEEALRQIKNLINERAVAHPAFLDRIEMPEVSFSQPRQCRKAEADQRGPQMPFKIGFPKTEDAARQHFEDAMEKFNREVLPPFREAVYGLYQTIEGSWRSMTPAMEMIAKIEAEMHGKPVHPKDIRDERGVKQPSPVPPFWAARPNGRRR